MIITDFGDVHAYLKQFEQREFPRPEVCPHCQVVGRMIGHGFYPRQAWDPAKEYVLQIKRWSCAACHLTVALLPSFVLRFRRYLLSVIQAVVVTHYESQVSWSRVAQRCAPDGVPSRRTIKRWCRSFGQHAARWWAAVQQTLAQQDAASPLLDPLGAAVGPREAPQALLTAALHLLAWAQTRWSALAHYGPTDRLRFLWHWGSSQGLGRLI